MTGFARAVAFVTSVALTSFSPLAAQGNAGEIRGRVVDAASKAPVGTATVEVSVAGAAAAVPLARASMLADGGFRVRNLAPGRYRVSIRALGFAPRVFAAVAVTAAAPVVDIGTVALTAAALELKAMDVTGKQEEVQFAPDRTSYVVRDMPTTRGGNALDVLRNVPSVDVDIDNIVSLRGNSGVIVQINGRPSPLKPQQLGNFLSQLSADMVDKVEVVPNPSARDDPTGVAGIINIVMRKKQDVGISGGITVSAGTVGQANVGGNFGYESGPLSLDASYGFLSDRRPRNDAVFRENLYASPRTYLDESGVRMQLPKAHTLTGSLGYELSDHDDVSADLTYSTRHDAESYNLLYRNLDNAKSLTSTTDRLSTGRNTEFSFESALGYTHSFPAKGHKLKAEINIVRDGEGGPGSVASHTLSSTGAIIATTSRETQDTRERPHENYLKVDYILPVSQHLRFETGYKGSLQDFHTTLDTYVFDIASSTFKPDSNRINNFTFRQNVQAAYAMVGAQRGTVQMQAGARVERATTRFFLRTLGSTYFNPYSSVFPSALVAWDVDATHQIKLSYSTRIRRPDEPDQLDPTLRYQDPLNIQVGNPYLKPEYIRALELGLKRSVNRVTILVNPYFRHTQDAMRGIRTIDTAGVATRTTRNVSTANAYGTDITIAVSGNGGRLSGFVGGSSYKVVSNAANIAPGFSVNAFGWSARTNIAYHFSKTVDAQALINYRPAIKVEQGRNGAQARFNFAARKKFMKDRMNLTLRVNDPFRTARERSITNDPRFYQITDRTRTIRGLVLSANWILGKPPRKEGALIEDGSP